VRYVYFDTDAFRNIGIAFKAVVLSPITAAEIMSQLVTTERAQILEQIQAMHNWLPEPPQILPLPSVIIAAIGFNFEQSNHTHLDIARSLDICMRTRDVEQLVAEANRQRNFLDQHKEEEAGMIVRFKDLSGKLRSVAEPPYDRTRIQAALQKGMASRIGMKESDPRVLELPELFSAFFEYENARFREVANNRHYSPANKKNINDVYDSEQMIYLANTDLFFLTCDRKYSRRVQKGKQASNIITAKPADLSEPTRESKILREIIEAA